MTLEHVASLKREELEAVLPREDRQFHILKNKCGPLKSAYAEAFYNYAVLLNVAKNPKQDGLGLLPSDMVDAYFTEHS
jgi:hypothetical protein